MSKMRIAEILSVATFAAAALSMSGCWFYSQDVGEVVVQRSMGGEIVGVTTDPGFHTQGLLDSNVVYSTRNNVISFIGEGSEDYTGGSANGPEVTCNDSSGARCEVDVQVNYSLDPSYAEELYSNYGTQESFVQYVVAVDVRSVTREVAGRYNTITLLTDRGSFTSALQDALAAKWDGKGITIEQVSVQEIRYSDAIVNKYAEAQAAEIEKAKAEAEQETARVKAETTVIEAQAQADANAILAESLSDEVLTEHYIQALSEIGASGNLVVVPEGSTPVVSLGGVR